MSDSHAISSGTTARPLSPSTSDSGTIEDPTLYQGMYVSPLAEPEGSKHSVLECKGDPGSSESDGKTEQSPHELPSRYSLLAAMERISALVNQHDRKIIQQDAKIESLEQEIKKLKEIRSVKGKRGRADRDKVAEETASKKRRVHFD